MVNLKIYDTVDEYKNQKIKMTGDMDVSMLDLKRYAVSLGNFSGRKITDKGEKFYEYLLEMSLEEYMRKKMKYFKIGEDYKNAEASIKNSISFFMGMIAAKAVAEKRYKVPLLYHLTDEILSCTTVGIQTTANVSSQAPPKSEKNFRPDFFGVNNKDEGFLFEAKGTVSKRSGNKTIEHAKEQIRNIGSVTLQKGTGNSKYDNSQLKGYIVASSFDKNDHLTYHCIDPEPEGGKKIEIGWEKAMILYYQNIMNFLTSNRTVPDDQDSRFVVSEYGLYKIGVEKRIYETLEKYKGVYDGSQKLDDTVKRGNLTEDCEKISSYISERQDSTLAEEMSLGLDGIICRRNG